MAPLSPWSDQRLHGFPSIVPRATWRADLVSSCGEPPDVAASVVGAQLAGPSYPTLADWGDVVVVRWWTSLAALIFTVGREAEAVRGECSGGRPCRPPRGPIGTTVSPRWAGRRYRPTGRVPITASSSSR